MSEWKVGKITDLVHFRTGKLNSNAEKKDGKYPFFTCSPETLRIDDYVFDCEALLLAGNNAEGNFSLKYYKGKFNAYQRTYVITIPDINFLSYKFFFYALQTRLADLKNISVGSATKFLTMTILNDIEIPLPSIEEQKSIASVLSSLDDKIDLLHRQNTTLEGMAETLFRQWFAEGNGGWESGKVSDLIDVLSGFAFKSTSFVENGIYRLMTIKAVQDGYLETNNADRITEIPANMPDYCDLQEGDILLSLTGNVGRCCLVDEEKLLLNQRVAKLRPKIERDRAFAYVMFRQLSMRTTLEEMAKGTAQANLSPVEMANMAIQIPPDDALSNYSLAATPMLKKLLFNKREIKTLEKLRDSLLPKLMSGEVRVIFQNEVKYG